MMFEHMVASGLTCHGVWSCRLGGASGAGGPGQTSVANVVLQPSATAELRNSWRSLHPTVASHGNAPDTQGMSIIAVGGSTAASAAAATTRPRPPLRAQLRPPLRRPVVWAARDGAAHKHSLSLKPLTARPCADSPNSCWRLTREPHRCRSLLPRPLRGSRLPRRPGPSEARQRPSACTGRRSVRQISSGAACCTRGTVRVRRTTGGNARW
jgi:hypothetical protein